MRQFSPSAFLPQLRDGEDGVHLPEHFQACWGGAFRCAKGTRNKWPEERRGAAAAAAGQRRTYFGHPSHRDVQGPQDVHAQPLESSFFLGFLGRQESRSLQDNIGNPLPRLLSVPAPEGSGVAPAGSHASLLAADLPREDVARCPYPSARALAELAEDVAHNVPR